MTPTKPARPRIAVQEFACQMERNLRKHDDERGYDGWKGDGDLGFLLDRLGQELREVRTVYRKANRPSTGWDMTLKERERFASELADVGNFAMMLHDLVTP